MWCYDRSWHLPFGIWVKYEIHYRKCECSYCQKFLGKFGLKLPQIKKNSWRVLYWRHKGRLINLRWTLPF